MNELFSENLPAVAEEKPKSSKPFYQPGLYLNLSNEEYHGSHGVSSSKLKKLLEKTPAHVDFESRRPSEPTPNMALGTAVHSLVLEPENFHNDIAIMPKLNLRTNAGKSEKLEFMAENEGKTIITPEQYQQAQDMAESVLNRDSAQMLLQDSINESSVYWWYNAVDEDDDTDYRQMCKVRPDIACKTHSFLADLKTTDDATESEFSKTMAKFYYHMSAAMYLEGVNQCQELLDACGHLAFTGFVFLVVESKPPYLATEYLLTHNSRRIGDVQYRRAMQRHHRAKKEDWPGFPDQIRPIDIPGWAERAKMI